MRLLVTREEEWIEDVCGPLAGPYTVTFAQAPQLFEEAAKLDTACRKRAAFETRCIAASHAAGENPPWSGEGFFQYVDREHGAVAADKAGFPALAHAMRDFPL